MSKYTSLKENINASISMHETVTCKANLCRINMQPIFRDSFVHFLTRNIIWVKTKGSTFYHLEVTT